MTERRILVAIPHPDDEIVGCAIALCRARAAGDALFGLYLTTGVPPADLLWRRQRRHYDERVAQRRAEALAAAEGLGLEPVAFSDRPSRRLKGHLAAAHAEIEAALDRLAPSELWVPAWEGGHQDHDATNFLGSRFVHRVAVREFAEYNLAGGLPRLQRFPQAAGGEMLLRLTIAEAALKRRLLDLYRSERANLTYAPTRIETLRPLPRHDYTAPPHVGTLLCERFHWVPFHHPSIDFERSEELRAALAAFGASYPAPPS
jgi:LmbE family N-acetylglucosaminyl deacetylase